MLHRAKSDSYWTRGGPSDLISNQVLVSDSALFDCRTSDFPWRMGGEELRGEEGA